MPERIGLLPIRYPRLYIFYVCSNLGWVIMKTFDRLSMTGNIIFMFFVLFAGAVGGIFGMGVFNTAYAQTSNVVIIYSQREGEQRTLARISNECNFNKQILVLGMGSVIICSR